MGSSRTVLNLKDTSKTKISGLESWPQKGLALAVNILVLGLGLEP